MATTTFKRDYLLRLVLNPGTTATDYIGRLTTATADYMGRNLVAALFPVSTAVTVGQLYSLASGVVLQVTVAGTTAASAPAAPGYGLTVVSGGATLIQITST